MENVILKDIPDLQRIEVYEKHGGYSALKKALKKMKREEDAKDSFYCDFH